MEVKKIIDGSKGEYLTISVDFDKINRTVDKVNYVLATKGTCHIDITEIFIEHLNGDDIIDKIDWRYEIESNDYAEEPELENDTQLKYKYQ